MTLSSIRGGTIPFDPASMDPANADYKIVQRFFDDGAGQQTIGTPPDDLPSVGATCLTAFAVYSI